MSDPAVIFETERLFVQSYAEKDLADFFRLNGDETVMRYIRPAQTLEQTRDFLKKIITDYVFQPGRGRWALRLKDGSFIGSFAIIPVEQQDYWQLGYALLPEYWGKGYASESVKGGLTYAFDQLGMGRIAGITYPENQASQQVLLRNGFVFDSHIREEGRLLCLYFCNNTGSTQQPV